MVGDTILIKDISINGNDESTGGLNTATSDQLSKTLTDNTINTLGIDASSRTIWINGQPYGNAYVNIKEDNTVEAPIGGEIFNDFEHNIASGDYSHAEGSETSAIGDYSHAEGKGTITNNEAEHAAGKYNQSNKDTTIFSVGIGESDTNRKNAIEVTQDGDIYVNGIGGYDGTNYSNSKDIATILSTVDTSDEESFKVEKNLYVDGPTYLHKTVAAGSGTTASGNYSHAEGRATIALGSYSHAEGWRDNDKTAKAEGMGSHTEGNNTATTVDGQFSHAEGSSTIAQGAFSHAEGFQTETGGEHDVNDKALDGVFLKGSGSHAEGGSTIAQGAFSHAEGKLTFAKGVGSHAEGYKTTALGLCSHAEGNNSKANGNYSHVSGSYNTSEGENSSLQGYYLFDHGIDTKDSFIWLQYPGEAPYTQQGINNPTLTNYGCGYIKIGEQYLIKPEQSTDDPRVGYYKVTGLYYVKGPKADLKWSQDITDDGSHEYYISSEDLNNIINESIEWDSESPNFLTPPFTIWRYQYDENSQDFVNDAEPPITVQGCGWLYDKTYKENYKQRLNALVEENVSEGVIKMSDMYNTYKQPNKVPAEFTNNNATIVGKYNKPQPDDIFEVGCGNIGSSLKITQSNAISVSSSGETTILKLNTGDITVGNANVNTLTSNMVTVGNANANTLVSNIVTVTSSDQSKSVQQQITQLPTSPEDGCQSIICKDGILIGYSQSKYMFLKIDDNGNIILGNRKPTEEQKTKDLSYLFV